MSSRRTGWGTCVRCSRSRSVHPDGDSSGNGSEKWDSCNGVTLYSVLPRNMETAIFVKLLHNATPEKVITLDRIDHVCTNM